MPSLQHYALRDESLEILRDLMEQRRLVAIPETPVLTEPRLERYEHYVPEIADRLAQFPVVLLEGPFTVHPLEFQRRDAGSAAGTYYVTEASGPRIRWTLPGLVTDDRPTLAAGSIGHLSTYRALGSKVYEPASDELKTAWRDVVRTMKKHLVRLPLSRGDAIWIGRKTREQLDAGRVFVDR